MKASTGGGGEGRAEDGTCHLVHKADKDQAFMIRVKLENRSDAKKKHCLDIVFCL